MAFNPFNLFKGNPKVLELMSNQKGIEELLIEESFVSEFKKSDNEGLQTYMNYERYEQLIRYITTIEGDESNKNRAFKFPYVSSEILSISNDLTYKFLIEEVVFTQDIVEQEIQVEKEIDSQSSDRSYSSIKSSNSSSSKKQIYENKPFEEDDKENFVIRDENDKTLAEFDFKDDRDICEQDFPDVKQKKVVVIKELVKRTVKRPYEPLVFKLLRYFESKEVIHILDGYVCRVLDSIFSNRFAEFLQIVGKYKAFNSIKRIFSHLQSNSVQQTLLNFISRLQASEDPLALSQEFVFIEFVQKISEIPYKQWPKKEKVLQQKTYILSLYCSIVEKIIGKFIPDGDKKEQKKESINIKGGLKQIAKILRPDHISKVITILSEIASLPPNHFLSKLTLQYCKLAKLILKGYSIIKNLDNKDMEIGEIETVKSILQSCEDCFDPIIQISYAFIFENFLQLTSEELTSYKPQNSLISKIQFIEIMGMLAKENIYFSRRTIIDDHRFQFLLKLLDIYPKSSIYHNGILNILLPFFSSNNDQPLIIKLLEKREIFSFLLEAAKSDLEMRYEKKGKMRKCYISQLTTICLALDEMKITLSELDKYRKGLQWVSIKECLMQDQQGMRKKVLGGHEKQREKKPLICFSKQDCLKHFAHFLAGTKLNSFDDFENYEPENSDSQDEQQSKAKFEQSSSTVDTTIVLPEDNSKYFEQDYVL